MVTCDTREEHSKQYLRLHILDDDVGEFASDVVEVTVDAVRRRRQNRRFDVAAFIVEGEIESQLFLQEGDFGLGTGESDDGAAFDLGDLTDHGADGAGRPAHQHHLTRLSSAYFQKTAGETHVK